MSAKTVYARNLQMRKPIAYLGTPNAPVPPVFATAHQKDGIVLIAVAGGNHIEVKPSTRVVVDYDPENVKGIKGLRYCHLHEGTPNLRFIAPDPKGTALCHLKSPRIAAAKAAGFKGWVEQAAVAKQEALDAAVLRAEARMTKPLSRDDLFAITLANVAHDLGTKSDRFAVLAAQYGYTMEHAVSVAHRELDRKGMVDASTQVSAA